MGAGVGVMQVCARQAGKPALRISDALIFRQVVANSGGHPQDGRMPAEVVAETDHDTRLSALWQSDQGQALRGGQGAGMFSET